MEGDRIGSEPAIGSDDWIVCGNGLEPPGNYVPAMLANGSVCLTSDFLGGTAGEELLRGVTVTPGIFVAGERLITERPIMFPIYSHGRYRLTLSIDGKACGAPDRWSQTLDPVRATSVVRNDFGGVVRVVETFVAADRDTIALRQTFPGADLSRISASLEYEEPKDARIVGGWTESPDGRAFRYTAYGWKVHNGRITLRHVREDGAFVTFISFGEEPYDGTYAELAARHEAAWRGYYAASEVSVPDPRFMRMRRMAEYQLRCYLTRWSLAVGLFPTHWNGNAFGFDEHYGVQGLLSAGHFDEARSVADFRFDTLEQAKRRVIRGGRGARWYWECMEDSEREGAPSGHWLDHIFHMSAIAGTCGLVASFTGDTDYLRERAFPVMRECARFFRDQYVYEAADGSAFIGKCTDFERLGTAKDRPCMTTCGAIHTFRTAADAAERLGVDAEEAADWRATADRLVKSLPVKDGRFVPAADSPDEVSVGTLGGFYPFPIFPQGHPEQTAALKFFLDQGARAGNMYVGGKCICPWYAGTMAAAALRAGERRKAYELVKGAVDSSGCYGEIWEINEPGLRMRPWFMTAAGNCLCSMNRLLLMEADGECRIGYGAPAEWRDWSFRLPSESGFEVECAVRDGKVARLVLRLREGRAIRNPAIMLVLPDGSRRTVALDRPEIRVV